MISAALLRKMHEMGLTREQIAELAELWERGTAKAVSAPDFSVERVWVYVMGVDHADDDALVKVGISKHPNYRLLTLAKERGLNLYLAHTEGPFSRARATEIESAAHQLLEADRERGEWFTCGAPKAIEVVKSYVNGVSR